MALRDGWFITKNDEGDLLYFKLLNGAPYQVEPHLGNPEPAIIAALEPGYYDDDLNQIPEEEAVAS